MKSITLLSIAGCAVMMSTVRGFKRPDEARWKWLPKVMAVTDNVDYNLYANGRGKVKDNGKSYCNGKWRNAETYGAKGKKIKQFCIRLHEWYQDDRGYEDAPAKYNCVLDPNDKGNRHGSKNRDWLCYEKQPKYVALPPFGPSYDNTCSSSTAGDEPWALSWYPDESPPEWCTYNWYSDRQVCWCMPGFYRESPYDTSLEKRGCPDEEVFVAPRFVTYDHWLQLREPATTTPSSPTQCSCPLTNTTLYTTSSLGMIETTIFATQTTSLPETSRTPTSALVENYTETSSTTPSSSSAPTAATIGSSPTATNFSSSSTVVTTGSPSPTTNVSPSSTVVTIGSPSPTTNVSPSSTVVTIGSPSPTTNVSPSSTVVTTGSPSPTTNISSSSTVVTIGSPSTTTNISSSSTVVTIGSRSTTTNISSSPTVVITVPSSTTTNSQITTISAGSDSPSTNNTTITELTVDTATTTVAFSGDGGYATETDISVTSELARTSDPTETTRAVTSTMRSTTEGNITTTETHATTSDLGSPNATTRVADTGSPSTTRNSSSTSTMVTTGSSSTTTNSSSTSTMVTTGSSSTTTNSSSTSTMVITSSPSTTTNSRTTTTSARSSSSSNSKTILTEQTMNTTTGTTGAFLGDGDGNKTGRSVTPELAETLDPAKTTRTVTSTTRSTTESDITMTETYGTTADFGLWNGTTPATDTTGDINETLLDRSVPLEINTATSVSTSSNYPN